MNDLISRQAAVDALISEGRNVDSHYLEYERIIHESDAVEAISMLPSAQPDKDMIHLQREQAYMQGWEDGRKALREEIWEDGRDRLD